MRLWDASTGAETTCLHGNIDTINDVAFSCVSTHLVAAGSDSALQVCDEPEVVLSSSMSCRGSAAPGWDGRACVCLP